jgi:hypothetical protein
LKFLNLKVTRLLKMTPTAWPLLLGACLMASIQVQVQAQEFVNKPADLPFNAVHPKGAGFSEEGLRNIDRFLAKPMFK